MDPVLQLDEVLLSVIECYPLIDVAIGELEAAEGKIITSFGEFDSILAARSESQALGFYQNYRNGVDLVQPLYGGGEVFGGYRIGRGNFEPWYGERETNDAGEFKVGFALPFLKDRFIDSRRADLFRARAGQQQVESSVNARLLQFQRFAMQAYWDWLAAARAVEVQQQLLDLALRRVDQIAGRIEKGDLAEIARIDNDRFIAGRRNELIKARRSVEKAAIKLSLFYRDGDCQPIIATAEQVPDSLPDFGPIGMEQLDFDVAQALAIRPELTELQAARRMACVDLRQAQNLTLPALDAAGFAAQDIGAEASPLGDKTPFQLELGMFAEVPLQRREGRGKIRIAEGKIAQIDAKLQFVCEKIRAELQDAASAVNAAFEQIQQSQMNVELSQRSLELGRQLFDAGDIDLIELNIYETSVADAELLLISAYFKYFFNLAAYETARSGTAFEDTGTTLDADQF